MRSPLVAVFVALIVTTAQAQETGTLIKRPAAQMQGTGKAGARITLGQFANCILMRRPKTVTTIMSLAIDSREYEKEMSRLFIDEDDECLSGGQLSFGTSSLRGGLFQAAYLKDYRFTPPGAFAADLDSGYLKPYTPPYSDKARAALSLQRFGDCAGRANPQAVHALAISNVASTGESAAFAALQPQLSSCIVRGEEIAFSKTILRGVLSEALYRLRKASGPSGKGQ